MKPREFFLPIEKREIFPSDYVYSSSVEMFERIAVPFIEYSAYQALEARHMKLLEALRTINPDDTYENYNEQVALEAIEADRLASEDWKEN